MGAFSELNLEKTYPSDPFEDGSDIPAFSEDAPADLNDTKLELMQDGEEHSQPQDAVGEPGVANISKEDHSNGDKQQTEDAKRRAHEESEAKRKAEWEARQQAKKAEEQAQIDKLASMSDEAVVNASMQRVSADTEKLTRRNMKECVAEYIQTMCIEDPAFARKTMHPRKSMIRCFQYISRKAWDYVQDELKANGIQPDRGQQGYGADVPDDLCYQWAVDYFNNPDVKEDHEDEEKFVPRPYSGGYRSSSKSKAKEKGEKKEPPKKPEMKKPEPKKPADSGQLTFGDFAMPEEMAG